MTAKKFSENQLSGRLTIFFKQGVGGKQLENVGW
jgi:hypothetical protein